MQNQLYITTALTGPLGRRLADEVGYQHNDENEFDNEVLDWQYQISDRIVSPLTTIAFGCIDSKYEPTFILKANDGEMREKIRAGNIFQREHLDVISDVKLWLKKFEHVKLLLTFGHANCAKVGELIESLNPQEFHVGTDEAISISPLKDKNVSALNTLASMAYTLSTANNIVAMQEVRDRLDNGQISLVPGYFASKILAKSRQNTLLIRDRTALYNYETAQFELPQNVDDLNRLWTAKFDGEDRSQAVENALRVGLKKYRDAIRSGDESLAISI